MKTDTMTPAEMNAAIAKICGQEQMWHAGSSDSHLGGPPYRDWPDYCGSLDAMHEAEKMLNNVQQNSYVEKLAHSQRQPDDTVHAAWLACHAAALPRARAFLAVMGEKQ